MIILDEIISPLVFMNYWQDPQSTPSTLFIELVKCSNYFRVYLSKGFSNSNHGSCAQIFLSSFDFTHWNLWCIFQNSLLCPSSGPGCQVTRKQEMNVGKPRGCSELKNCKHDQRSPQTLLDCQKKKWQQAAATQWSNIFLIICKVFYLASSVSLGNIWGSHLFFWISCQMSRVFCSQYFHIDLKYQQMQY